MDWIITATQDEASFLDDYIRDVIAHEPAPLPEHDLRIGHVDVHWHQVEPGVVFVAADGGTSADKVFAEDLVMAELKSYGYKRAMVKESWENPPNYPYPSELPFPPGGPEDKDLDRRRWGLIQDKARRLVQSGAVTLNQNGRRYVNATVDGDHGTYDVEVHRDDPNSMAHTTSSCTCNWGGYQNLPRTRQWRRFQDRSCAHILATKWQAAATPLDEDRAPGNFGQPGQMAFPGMGGPMQAPSTMPLMQQAPTFPTEPQPEQGFPQPGAPQAPNPMQAPATPGEAPTPEETLPPFPMDQQQPPHNPISMPGGKPQTPLNPVQYPQGPGGTFSSWRPAKMLRMAETTYRNGDRVQLLNEDFGTLVGRSEEHGAGQQTSIPKGQIGEVLGTHPSTGMVNVLYMGKPWENNGELKPYGAQAWHWPSDVRLRSDIRAPGPNVPRSRPVA